MVGNRQCRQSKNSSNDPANNITFSYDIAFMLNNI
jgi:hypothetical protein